MKIVFGFRLSLFSLLPRVSVEKILSTRQQHRPRWHRLSVLRRQLPVTRWRGRSSFRIIPRTSTPVCPGLSSHRDGLHQNLISKNQLANFRILVSRPQYSYSERSFRLSCGTSDHLQITLQCLGAAAAISAPSVPDWKAGLVASYTNDNVGGLLNAMLSPLGGFGKVLMVVLSLSVIGNNAPGLYSMCMAFQTLIPPLAAVPRYVFSVFVTAV
jgi:hypothetical protein